MAHQTRDHRSCNEPAKGRPCRCGRIGRGFFARPSATWLGRPAITDRATSLLKGDRADVVEAGVFFSPAERRMAHQTRDHRSCNEPVKGRPCQCGRIGRGFSARPSATWLGRPAITERATSLLKGDRADVVEAGVFFSPAERRMAHQTRDHRSCNEPVKGRPCQCGRIGRGFFARPSATWLGRPAITDRATSLLKGDRANVVESGVVFPPDRVPHGSVGPRSPIVQRAC